MGEGEAVLGHDCGAGTLGHGQLPGIVLAKAAAGFARAALKFGAFFGVLETQGLRHVAVDEGKAASLVGKSLQKFRDADA